MQYVVLGWAQSVGTVTVGGSLPAGPPHAASWEDRRWDRGHSHSDPQSVQPKVCFLREKHDRRRGEPRTRQMIDR